MINMLLVITAVACVGVGLGLFLILAINTIHYFLERKRL